jgi:hypothetical protein
VDLYKVGTPNHVRLVSLCLPRFRASASIDVRDFSLEVRARNRFFRFYPQFLVRDAERARYTPNLEPRTRGFCGWLPYFNKRWPAGSGKFAFKQFCREKDLPTPASWRTPPAGLRDFVVKRDRSSLGQGLHGPFAAYNAADPAQAPGDEVYYEQFVKGRIVKAWYWEDRLAAVESLEMPGVQGDGTSTLRELIRQKMSPGAPRSERAVISAMVAYQGRTLDEVPAAGERVLADYRYGSFLHPSTVDSDNVLEQVKEAPLGRQLAAFGPIFYQSIPSELRRATLYTVDAILDENERLWLLEMNCNPLVHPDAYFTMFEGLFGAAEAEQSQGEVQAPEPPPASALPLPFAASYPGPYPAATQPLHYAAPGPDSYLPTPPLLS